MSDSNSPKQIALAEACNESGLAFFRFDHRGCGISEGNFIKDTTFQNRCRDLVCALEKLESLGMTSQRIGLFGSSLGGSVCLNEGDNHYIKAMVTFAAPVRSTLHANQELPKGLVFDISNKLSRLNTAHIFHGDNDETVPLSHAQFIYQHVQIPKKMTIQEKGDHRMSNPDHQKTFLKASVEWFRHYLK